MKSRFLLSVLLIFSSSLYGLKLDRVILGCDLHREYIDFWPLVAKAWKQIVGITPTLALIAPEGVYVDESVGQVIRFDPIPGIPTHMQAQVIRLLLPTLFPEDGCIISDIDMVPCVRDYFVNTIATIPDNCFVVYRDQAYPAHEQHYPMCYNAAKGKVFAELFNVHSKEEIYSKIVEWYNKNAGWYTDERMLYDSLELWSGKKNRCIKLGHGRLPRLDRGYWHFNPTLIKQGYYLDAHCPKPYHLHVTEIDQLAQVLGIPHNYYTAWSVPKIRNQTIDTQHSSYIVPLTTLLMGTKGPVLEMGTDDIVSPMLHVLCQAMGRFLGTTETDLIRLSFFSSLITHNHLVWLMMTPGEEQIRYPTLDKWDNVYGNYQWSVVIMNEKPVERRSDDFAKMRAHADIVLIPHADDAMRAAVKSCRYVLMYDRYEDNCLIVSDTIDVMRWFE